LTLQAVRVSLDEAKRKSSELKAALKEVEGRLAEERARAAAAEAKGSALQRERDDFGAAWRKSAAEAEDAREEARRFGVTLRGLVAAVAEVAAEGREVVVVDAGAEVARAYEREFDAALALLRQAKRSEAEREAALREEVVALQAREENLGAQVRTLKEALSIFEAAAKEDGGGEERAVRRLREAVDEAEARAEAAEARAEAAEEEAATLKGRALAAESAVRGGGDELRRLEFALKVAEERAAAAEEAVAAQARAVEAMRVDLKGERDEARRRGGGAAADELRAERQRLVAAERKVATLEADAMERDALVECTSPPPLQIDCCSSQTDCVGTVVAHRAAGGGCARKGGASGGGGGAGGGSGGAGGEACGGGGGNDGGGTG
jgi:chromosome segregation ATPase